MRQESDLNRNRQGIRSKGSCKQSPSPQHDAPICEMVDEAGIRRFENEFWKRQRVEGKVRKKPKVTGTNKTKGRKLGFYNEFKESFYVQTTSIPFSKLNRLLPWV